MKSREYRSINTGIVYWLEDCYVMCRSPKHGVVMVSALSAAEFFIKVGRDEMILVEGE